MRRPRLTIAQLMGLTAVLAVKAALVRALAQPSQRSARNVTCRTETSTRPAGPWTAPVPPISTGFDSADTVPRDKRQPKQRREPILGPRFTVAQWMGLTAVLAILACEVFPDSLWQIRQS
jgi:hypothetical protein